MQLPITSLQVAVSKTFRLDLAFGESLPPELRYQVTFACDEHPGPARPYCVACEDHIMEVLAVDPPVVTRTQ